MHEPLVIYDVGSKIILMCDIIYSTFPSSPHITSTVSALVRASRCHGEATGLSITLFCLSRAWFGISVCRPHSIFALSAFPARFVDKYTTNTYLK